MIKLNEINLLKTKLSKINFSGIKSSYVSESLRESAIASFLAVIINLFIDKGALGFWLIVMVISSFLMWYTGLIINIQINTNQQNK